MNTGKMSEEEWKTRKSFHDDSDTLSENSEHGLILDDIPRRWQPKVVYSTHLRLAFEAVLVLTVLVLSSLLIMNMQRAPAAEKRFGPRLPRKVVTFGDKAGFGPDLVYADFDMLRNATRMREVHENWQALYPKGRGYVIVDEENEDFIVNNKAFDIDIEKKIGTVDGRGKGWIMSVYHQLHCLSIISSRMGIPHSEFATWDDYHLNHVSHCVEYLRQAILCSADTSLEGETGAFATSTGWGQKHMCVDFDALTEYGNTHAAWDLTGMRVVDLHKRPGHFSENVTLADGTTYGN